MNNHYRDRQAATSYRRYEKYFEKRKVFDIPSGMPTRYDGIYTPWTLRKEVRKDIRTLLKKDLHPALQTLKIFLGFGARTAVIFGALMLLMNVQTYMTALEFWFTSSFGGSERETQYTFFTKAQESSPLSNSEGFPISENGFYGESRFVREGSGNNEHAMNSFLSSMSITTPDNRIIIPAIGQNIPIKEVSAKNLVEENWQALEDDIQEELRDGVVRYPGTATPGQRGNVFITGHSSYYLWNPGRYKDVFALLHNVDVGDRITVFYNQKEYIYEVEEKKTVSPEDVDVLKQTTDKRLTLMTCTPIGTALNRLILIAKQVE